MVKYRQVVARHRERHLAVPDMDHCRGTFTTAVGLPKEAPIAFQILMSTAYYFVYFEVDLALIQPILFLPVGDNRP